MNLLYIYECISNILRSYYLTDIYLFNIVAFINPKSNETCTYYIIILIIHKTLTCGTC